MPRYYENKYPEVDQLVMVQVQAIEDMGAYVKLVRCDALLAVFRADPSSSTTTSRE